MANVWHHTRMNLPSAYSTAPTGQIVRKVSKPPPATSTTRAEREATQSVPAG